MPSGDPVRCHEQHAKVCGALADPKRLLIIDRLRDGPLSVSEVAEALGISQPNASQHLALLRASGMVSARRSGSSVHYALTSPKILEVVELLREFTAEDHGRSSFS
ncbi:MAG: ArsR/SmtB family transcription factor [Mycobacteriales bacterium]